AINPDVEVDRWGNVYVTGFTRRPSDRHVLIVKYSPAGHRKWARIYRLDWANKPVALEVGNRGNFYIAGTLTRQNTFTDSALTVASSNPVVADGNGLLDPIYLDATLNYKVDVTDSLDSSLEGYPVDNLTAALTATEVGTALWPTTTAETSASVTPTSLAYKPGDNRRYGTGITSIQDAIDVMEQEGGGFADVWEGTYTFGATTLTIPSKVDVRCAGVTAVTFTYSGTGIAIDMDGSSHASISGFYLSTTDDAATGVRLGSASRRDSLWNFFIQGTSASSNTGTGIWLDGSTGWSAGLVLSQYYILGYKFGIRFTGTNLSTGTWTLVTSTGGWINGRGAGVVSGSEGISMDALTNGIGTVFIGGTIESFETGIKHYDGGKGLFYTGDMEGNTADWVLGASFNGRIDTHNGNKFIELGANSTTNRWMGENHLFGAWATHSRNDRLHTLHKGSDTVRKWGLMRESIEDDSDSERIKFIVGTGSGGDQASINNYTRFLDYKTVYSAAAPTTGAYHAGSLVWKTAPAQSASPGWVCITTGTFGTATDSTGDTDGSTD
ncbi:hypothetical protein LCGC14_2355670, partial [marine sediment metagenome]